MIFFPSLFIDELFYSAQARYHSRSGNDNPKNSMNDMFGSRSVCAAIMFPSHLNNFCERLPVPFSYQSKEIFDGHSFIPYFSPFIQEQKMQMIIKKLECEDGKNIYLNLGIAASEIQRHCYLKYCSMCIKEDEKLYGEPYWHRSHQSFGVNVCYKHGCYLKNSYLELTQRNKHSLFTLFDYLSRYNQSLDDVDYCNNAKEKYIAEQSYHLLNAQIKSVGSQSIRQFYVSKLLNKGLITGSGRVRWRELLPQFNEYYGEQLLINLSSFIEIGNSDTWIHKLLRKPRVLCHPLRHILFLGFINEDVRGLNNLSSSKLTIKQPVKILRSNSASMGQTSSNRVDWSTRDIDLNFQVRQVATDIINEEEKLIRVTKTEICRRLRIELLLKRKGKSLPRTQEAFVEVVESVEQFQIRRIKSVIKQLSKKRINVQVWEVNRAAGLRGKFHQQYKTIIEEELKLVNNV